MFQRWLDQTRNSKSKFLSRKAIESPINRASQQCGSMFCTFDECVAAADWREDREKKWKTRRLRLPRTSRRRIHRSASATGIAQLSETRELARDAMGQKRATKTQRKREQTTFSHTTVETKRDPKQNDSLQQDTCTTNARRTRNA